MKRSAIRGALCLAFLTSASVVVPQPALAGKAIPVVTATSCTYTSTGDGINTPIDLYFSAAGTVEGIRTGAIREVLFRSYQGFPNREIWSSGIASTPTTSTRTTSSWAATHSVTSYATPIAVEMIVVLSRTTVVSDPLTCMGPIG